MHAENIVLVLIGASTGGLRVLGSIFSNSPKLNASIIVIQHMRKGINEPFKKRLNENTEMGVKIAEDGDILEAGEVYIAPSGLQMEILDNRRIRLFSNERATSVKPAIDVTMKSLKDIPGSMVVGVILTGMGKDGVDGITHIKSIGGITIAQDRDSSAIYGMPGAAVETGDVDFSLPPEEIREKLIEVVGIKE